MESGDESQDCFLEGDHPIIMCIGLPGYPLKITVGQESGQPYLLELRD